ncbi:MAG: YbeD family protein [Gammaproteobacteria bacterium]
MPEKNNKELDSSDTLLEFPCQFSIKAFGIHENEFDLLVVEIVTNHLNTYLDYSVTKRESSNGKYLSVSITITAESKAQLDDIYNDLSDHERVTMAL